MKDYYILKDKKAVATKSVEEWGRFFNNIEKRKVAYDVVEGVGVSTVFLGINHRFGDGPPLLFETLVIDGELDGEMNRYATWEEAEKGHAKMIKKVRATFQK